MDKLPQSLLFELERCLVTPNKGACHKRAKGKAPLADATPQSVTVPGFGGYTHMLPPLTQTISVQSHR